MDNLTRDVMAANAAGMSYGKWKAMHPNTSELHSQEKIDIYIDERIKTCPICGREFIPSPYSNKYCSKPCSEEANRVLGRIRHRNKKDAKMAGEFDEG